jgi:hypothetical protein
MNNYVPYTIWKLEMIPKVYNQCCGSASLLCGSDYHFDADRDAGPDFYSMRIRISLFTLMRIRIRILASK